MRLTNNELSTAVRLALVAVSAVAGMSALPVFAQDAAKDSSQKLETIEVTGSNIRRVDFETANPVVTIDRAAIERSGKLTLGDLVQELPSVTGPQTNPRVNNSGGSGASSIGLRGLGSQRTLVLINGHRWLSGDPNSLPASLVERIEVLTDGASATYGSDAIGGVVNFILRKDYQGAEISTDYGISDRDDGERKGVHITFGQTSDKGSIMAGIDYNKQNAIFEGNRKFSSVALSLSSGTPKAGGSPTGAFGNVQIPSSFASQISGFNAADPNCKIKNGTITVARNHNATGSSPGDYHCFKLKGTDNDGYNYAAVNLDLTPQERTGAFVVGNYKLTDNVEAYLEVYHNKTDSAYNLAPLPASTGGGIVVSSQSYYNPFGVNFNKSDGYKLGVRLEALGFRHRAFETTNDQVTTGFRGNFQMLNHDWNWNAQFNYGHVSQTSEITGLFNLQALNKALGPSFLDPATGLVTCGTPGSPIAGCTPVNAFNPATTRAGLQATAFHSYALQLNTEKVEQFDINGGVFDLPAGTAQLALGVSHRFEYLNASQDEPATIHPDGSCSIISSQCSTSVKGAYSVKEAYSELLLPVLKDMPFVNTLNVILGDRYSKYSNFGSTNNWKLALEYRPIDDLLLRATVSKVFRAPTIGNIFAGPGANADKAVRDPCDYAGTGPNPHAGSPACVNVPANGSFLDSYVADGSQFGTTTSGSKYAGFPLGPEFGKSFDFGMVYDPHWLPGLSVSADIWRLYLENTITGLGAQNILDLCSAGQAQFCSLIHRIASGPQQGQFDTTFAEPTGNLGRIDVKGVDFGATYRLPETPIGRFTASVNATYLGQYNNATAPGTSANTVYHYAGHFEPFGSPEAGNCASGNCLYPRWRATSNLNWNIASFDVNWKMRYVGKFALGYPNVAEDQDPAAYGQIGTLPPVVLHYGATVYHDVSVGYTIAPINTRVDVGIDNVGDKQPPLLYANNTLNANTDPSDFDTVGRFYWARLTVKF